METMQKTDFDINSTSNVNPVRKPILIESNNKKLYATIAIISAIALITIIVLMAVFLSKKNNKPKRNFARHFSKSDDLHQNIELLIGGNEVGKRRNLQEEEKIQILGTNFEEFNSTDAILYLDGKKIPFDKYLFIKSDSPVKINIKFRKKIGTFKGMFSGCNRIEKISLINVEPDFISETTSMFENCSSLSGVNFTNTTLNKITSTSKMFQNCSNLNTLHLEDFSTYEAKDMSKMFEGCSSFNDTSFIENLSTKNAEFLNEIFSGCSSIKSLKLTGYDTSNVKNMSGMFKGMSSLEELEISSFNTEKVEKMNEMFESCTSIQTLNLSNFNTEKVINMNGMFTNCLKLIELDVTSFQLTRCNNTENMFSNTTRELMLSIEKNEELMKYAGNSWSEKYDEKSNITKVLLDNYF